MTAPGEPYEPSWRHHANCAGANGDIFFPLPGTGIRDVKEAKRICAACRVREDCLAFALAENIKAGIWGGKTFKERLAIRLRGAS